MKKLNAVLIILISTFASCAQENESSIPKIKSEEIIFYKLDPGSTRIRREGPGMDELIEYNAEGKIIQVSVIELDETKNKNIYLLHERYFYEDNNLIKKEKIGYQTGEVYEETSYQYQQNKLIRQEVKSIDNGKEVLKQDGSFYSTYIYGDNTETEKFYGYNEEKKTFVLAYAAHKQFDANKNLVQEKLEDINGEIYEQSDLIYNKENKLIKTVKSLRSPSTTTYKYNKEGHITENIHESEGTIITTTYTFKYDTKGNWIEKKEAQTTNIKRQIQEPEYIIKRNLTYY